MTIRNLTTKKARRADEITGRGKTPDKMHPKDEPRKGDRLFCCTFGTSSYYCIFYRGDTPACGLWPILGLGGTIADLN